MPTRALDAVLELTRSCRAGCIACPNPIDCRRFGGRVATADWLAIIDSLPSRNIATVRFAGGEPLLGEDLELLIARAAGRGLTPTVLTSGVTLDRERLVGLRAAGLAELAVRFPTSNAAGSSRLAAVLAARAEQLPFAIHVVLEREGLDAVGDIMAMAADLGAVRVELAPADYTWRWRRALVPSDEQVRHARAIAAAAQIRLGSRLAVVFGPTPAFVITPDGVLADGLADAVTA